MANDGQPMDWAFVAEDADAYLPPSPMADREVRPEVVLLHGRDGGAWSNLASRIRFDEATFETGVATTRRWFIDRDVGEFRWQASSPIPSMPVLLERMTFT